MSHIFHAGVAVIGTTDVQAVIAEFETFHEARYAAALAAQTDDYDAIQFFSAVPPWAFEDKMVVRFSFDGHNTVGLDTLVAFSAQHPSWFFDLQWQDEMCEAGHGERLIHNNKVIAEYIGGFRSETAMQAFVEPEPDFFVDYVGLTLPQLFKYRLKTIADQIKNAAEIVRTLEPDFYGVHRDKTMTARAQQTLDVFATQAAFAVSTLHLEDVLFPHPDERPELRAKIDALESSISVASEDEGVNVPF